MKTVKFPISHPSTGVQYEGEYTIITTNSAVSGTHWVAPPPTITLSGCSIPGPGYKQEEIIDVDRDNDSLKDLLNATKKLKNYLEAKELENALMDIWHTQYIGEFYGHS